MYFRIKTNGSLPRDKRPGYNSPFNSPKNSPKCQPQFSFESPNATRKIINQNETSPNSLQSNSSSMEKLSSPSTNTSSKWQNDSGFSTSTVQSQSFNYENVKITIDDDTHNTIRNETTRQSPITFGTTKSNNGIVNGNSSYESMSINGNTSIYENVMISSMQNDNKNYSTTLKRHDSINNNNNDNKTCEKIDNKITISNDDLLEAIEQLSMLSKPKEICVTPKKNELTVNNKSNADKKRKELQDEDKKKYIEFLKNEKLHILGNMDVLKRSVADIEVQEEEINRAVNIFVFFHIFFLDIFYNY